MKQFSTIIILLLLILAGRAHARVLDPISRIEARSLPKIDVRGDDDVIKYRSMIIECESPEGFDELRNNGVIIYHTRGNMALACVPEQLIQDLDSWPSLMRATMSRVRTPLLDVARTATHVDAVQSGAGLPQPFTGKGVVTGLSDVGFDPGHAAFRGRVKGLSHFVDTTASAIRIPHPAESGTWLTDNSGVTHATHVAGIIAGGDTSTPYTGIAPEADIYATTSILHDAGILAGVEDIIAYAKEVGKPAVINLSLGSKIGPHDGTDPVCRYLDLCAESDAAILVAAGNDGNMNVSASKTFTADDRVLSTRLRSTYWDDVTIYNAFIDVWSSDERPLKLRLRAWDKPLEVVTFNTGMIELKDGEIWELSSDNNTDFAQLYDGRIMAAAEPNPTNGRYNISISVSIHCKKMLPDHPWSNHSMIIDICGEEGAHADAFIEGECEFNYSPPYEVTTPSADFSVSSMACGHNTVCIGSATTRNVTPLLTGDRATWQDLTPGTTSTFTSYATLNDGRRLPHFCAPGAMIVSALNRHYLNANPDFTSRIAAESLAAPGHYYYAECGTSMATPHAAGIFALWLEADPTLTGPELRDIAIATCSHTGIDMNNPRAGAGLIDARAGLRYILNSQGITDAELPDGLVQFTREGQRIMVTGADDARIEAFDICGRRCDPSALPPGPVIVRLTDINGAVIASAKLK